MCASTCIGKGVALALAQVGVEVAIASLNIGSAQAAVDEINSAAGKATAFVVDATRLQDLEWPATEVLQSFGSVG